jgi:hypothetical protein
MERTQNQVAPQGAGASAGARQQNPARIPATEIYDVRSYMFELETKEVLHIDRVGNPWASDIARVLEKLAVGVPAVAIMSISDDYISLKVGDRWKVGISRDGAVIIKVPDCVLVADDKFLLLCMDDSGLYVPVAKAETITWDGTEEYFEPADVRRMIKDVLKRVLERTQWL